jgi:HAMP domain-containing protein
VVERDTPIGPTLNLARPISIRDEACLSCHSTPYASPTALTRTYGTVNGFGWKPNETIGAQIVSLPMAVPLKFARDAYVTFLIILVAIFAIAFVVLNLLLHYLVIAPVKRVSAMADAISLGGEHVEAHIKPGKDEISSLPVSFNRMRESLKHAMEMIKYSLRRRASLSGSRTFFTDRMVSVRENGDWHQTGGQGRRVDGFASQPCKRDLHGGALKVGVGTIRYQPLLRLGRGIAVADKRLTSAETGDLVMLVSDLANRHRGRLACSIIGQSRRILRRKRPRGRGP